MKTYVITLSAHFPATHKRAGEDTYFKEQLGNALTGQDGHMVEVYNKAGNQTVLFINTRKAHTIRANFPLWEKRIKEIQDGKACLSVRQWTGKPYRSKQVEIARLTAADGVGIQKLKSKDKDTGYVLNSRRNVLPVDLKELALNDGLSLEDWLEWFKDYDFTQPLAIIHFTSFRYWD